MLSCVDHPVDGVDSGSLLPNNGNDNTATQLLGSTGNSRRGRRHCWPATETARVAVSVYWPAIQAVPLVLTSNRDSDDCARLPTSTEDSNGLSWLLASIGTAMMMAGYRPVAVLVMVTLVAGQP